MTDAQQRVAAKKFAEFWKGKGYEKGQSQPFWLSLLRDVYGIEHTERFADFESKAHIDHRGFIDIIIPSTKVLIEQKSLNIDLRKPIKQSDGASLTPFQQAKRYITELPLSKHPRWVITCNFSSFLVYDMEQPGGEPEEILLENLPTEFYRLSFLVDSGVERLKRETEISIAAGEIAGLLYDAFAKRYVDPTSERALKSLNVLCVRLVFCLYADDAGIFGRKGMFHDYIAEFEAKHTRKALIDLFGILDALPENRDPYLDESLAKFPYVNGGLFNEKDIEIPNFTDEIKTLLLSKASENFNCSEISPTIFGAIFESALNPETRRSGGMHYTSTENIRKLIDPLFFDELKKEFSEICAIAIEKTKIQKLKIFQSKLASLLFLDPACGSGNFLTETYLNLRRLENEILSVIQKGQIQIGDVNHNPIQVSISQFYGIEINDFAVTVARTALWIAESQMIKETEIIIHTQLDYLPLKTYANIVEGNALRIDWESVAPKNKISYIIGNPPFVGARIMSNAQKKDITHVFGKIKNIGKLDYVCSWYKKATDYMKNTYIKAAFVSTNSITQGEQPAILWKPLMERGIFINFGVPTFKWSNEAKGKASVHCVIISFSYIKNEPNVNQYLLEAPTIFISSRKKPICDVPFMGVGNQPTDGGNLIIEEKDYLEFITKEPFAKKYIKKFAGAEELINNKKRYCLWLYKANPSDLRKMPLVLERIEKCRQARLKSSDAGTRKMSNSPTLFRETRNPDNFLFTPKISSERRYYIPMGFLGSETIPSNTTQVIPNATLYHFGILTSSVHMAWTRAVCGRLEMRYIYSKDIVYNNFPWPSATEEQKTQIEKLAQAVLDARANYPDSSLADLYDPLTMPLDLLEAHQNLDRAVMQMYNFPVKDFTEADCVARLMGMYEELINNKI